ncbi:ABC transporter substrate-binding protein [Radiobacillus sp. PE A8.2]|uniref:ABC transporter substrate-binding protein n=1 Tax=Radiobacillus sp. PE A8.2 TaxID=3380349 RepID=UPI00388D8FAB
MKNKKWFVSIVIMLLILVAFTTACSDSTGVDTGEGDNGDEQVTLKMFMAAGQFSKGNFGYNQVQEFMEANPNIKVEITRAPPGDQWLNSFYALASSDDLPDIIQPPNQLFFPDMVQNEWIQPLDGLVSSDFKERFPEETFIEGYNMIDGEIYSFPRILPKRGDVLQYNKDIMEQAGLDPNQPPKTWDELLSMSKTITEKVDGVYGFTADLKDPNGYQMFIGMSNPLHPTVSIEGFDYKEGRYAFDDPGIIEGFEFLLELKDAGVIHPNSLTFGGQDAQGAFANKQVAFYVFVDSAVRINEKELGGVEDYDITTLPVPEEGMTFHQINSPHSYISSYISSTTEHPEAAGKLIDWLSSEDYFQKQLEDGMLLSPISKQNETADSEQLQSLAKALEDSLINFPNPQLKNGGLEVKSIEGSLAKPQPDWWQIIQGAYVGEIEDWKAELKKVNDIYNDRFDKAMKQAQEEGADVSREDFQFPDFEGDQNYSHE